MSKKIAIIGTGITGLAAAWHLNRAGYDIHVYEANDYIGGHSNTISGAGHAPVDTGFIVYNEATYPNLIALFDYLDVPVMKTDMSFGVSIDGGAVEYSSHALFAQRKNLFSRRFYKMLRDLIRFYREAPKWLEDPDHDPSIPLDDYLVQHHYSRAFIEDHLYPMAAAIWSTPARDVGAFPAKTFITFCVNHGLLKLRNRPQWYTVKGGSREYVWKITHDFRNRIYLNTPVRRVERYSSGAIVHDSRGNSITYDEVVLATHSDQALGLLSDADADETRVLSAFPYSRNTAYLHRDNTLMPKRRKVWSSWNYMSAGAGQSLCLSYWMNRLQPYLPDNDHLFVTLNPDTPPAREKTLKTITYDHPLYTLVALEGWQHISAIQGRRHTWFCGAWCGYGFHEDGLSAGLAVAEAISGQKRPWDVRDSSPAGGHAISSP